MQVNYTKFKILTSDVAGVVPTIPIVSNHKQAGWIPETDIYEGEFFLNTADKLVYTRAGSEILTMSGGSITSASFASTALSSSYSTIAATASFMIDPIWERGTGNLSAQTVGTSCVASGSHSVAFGTGSYALRDNQLAHGSGLISNKSIAQFGRIVYNGQTTNNTATVIGTFQTETNHIYAMRVLGVGSVAEGAAAGSVSVYGGYNTTLATSSTGYIKNIAGKVTINSDFSKVYAMDDGHGSDAAFPGLNYITLDTSGSFAQIKVTGATSNTINWAVTLEWTELGINL